MKKKIFYWCPFIDNVATVKAVINSCYGLKKYSNNITPTIINCFGEFNIHKTKLDDMQIEVINLNNFNFIKKIPNKGFFFSRILYLIIFILSFFPLVKLINKEKPHYFISHLITSLPLICFKLFNFKTRHILRISGLPKLNFFRFFLWKFASNSIYLVTCPTQGTFGDLIKKKLFNKDKICLLEDPIIHINELKNKNQKIQENYVKKNEYILSVGRLTKQKNFELLINFFNSIEKNNPKLKLIIIGKGENYHQLKKLINNFNLQKKIFLVGFKENVLKYMNNARLFILTSRWEDPGFVLIEAAASRALVLSSDCPNGPKEILLSGKNGILFKNNDICDLRKKFLDIKNMSLKDIKTMKLRALKNVKKYTIFFHTKKLINILL